MGNSDPGAPHLAAATVLARSIDPARLDELAGGGAPPGAMEWIDHGLSGLETARGALECKGLEAE